jgi:viroplasmin and RNaseH domain-containing protein
MSFVSGKIFSDKTWAECEKRVKGKPGAKYKKVFSEKEKENLVALWSLKSLF